MYAIGLLLIFSCNQPTKQHSQDSVKSMTAKEILGNPNYRAISYGGYRQSSRDIQPTVDQLKEDMKILNAMGIRIIRTYNVHLAHASNVLKAIQSLKSENENFEMYVMLGAWIDCKNAWTEFPPDHQQESERNEVEIAKTVELAKKYPDIVKIIAVGNEAMVHWAGAYFVQPDVILKWVNYLQEMKRIGELPSDLWVTSSDNFASWGGGGPEYHKDALNNLIKAVDYISMHTYPMHDTHYNPIFWGITKEERDLDKKAAIDSAMNRSLAYAKSQYESVKSYMLSLGENKPIHIGETGWASADNHLYGDEGSKATDEYKEGVYRRMMREWTDSENISCFFFEAFDEPWKDASNEDGSENHFGLFTKDGQAKYAIWSLVDEGVFEGLTRAGNRISKTHGGNEEIVLEDSPYPPVLETTD